jgi:mono/diheme cytochrome c family protein
MRRFSSLLLLFALAALPAAAQSPSPQGTDPSWTAPEKDAERKNPLASKPELAAGGQRVFNRTCASCHGDAEHRATSKAPDLASEAVQAQSDGAIFWKITNGNTKKAMPSWGSIPEPQRWQLVLYVRSLRDKK